MCIICVDYQKQLLTADEARWNMREMGITPVHREEIEVMIEDRELVEKITTAPARFTFNINVGAKTPEAALTYIKEVKRRLKSNN